MKVEAIDHVHFCVPELEGAMHLFEALVGGEFGDVYGGEKVNAWGVWHPAGLDVVQPIRDAEPVFGAAIVKRKGITGVSFRVKDLDSRIPELEVLGLHLVSRVDSESIGYGKFIVQAQFHPADSFGATVEICDYVLPGHIPGTPFRKIIDHVDLYVRDLDKATRLFADITGADFSPAETVSETKAKVAIHPLGLQITQPISSDSPIARTITEKGEGIHAIAFRTSNLNEGVVKARSAGLRMVRQTGGKETPKQVEFDPADSFGMTVKLVDRP